MADPHAPLIARLHHRASDEHCLDWELIQDAALAITESQEVLQAVLDAIKGTIDVHRQIADHPNVKFAQMQRLKLETQITTLQRQLQEAQQTIGNLEEWPYGKERVALMAQCATQAAQLKALEVVLRELAEPLSVRIDQAYEMMLAALSAPPKEPV